MKNDQYFKVEVNMFDDDDVMIMMDELGGMEALGVYMAMLLHLRVQDDYESSCKPAILKILALRFKTNVEMLERMLRDYNLFVIDEERQTFRSPYIDRVMKALEDRRKLDDEREKKKGRPRKNKSAETPASKEQKPNQNQKSIEEESREEESKEEKNKGITTVEYNSSNTNAGKSDDDDEFWETTDEATEEATDADPCFAVDQPTPHYDSPHASSSFIPRLTEAHPTPRADIESAYSLPLKLNTFVPQSISGKYASGANSPNTEEPEPLIEAYTAP